MIEGLFRDNQRHVHLFQSVNLHHTQSGEPQGRVQRIRGVIFEFRQTPVSVLREHQFVPLPFERSDEIVSFEQMQGTAGPEGVTGVYRFVSPSAESEIYFVNEPSYQTFLLVVCDSIHVVAEEKGSQGAECGARMTFGAWYLPKCLLVGLQMKI